MSTGSVSIVLSGSTGGSLSTADGTVTVSFVPGAAQGEMLLVINHVPLSQVTEATSSGAFHALVSTFQILAFDQEGAPMRSFEQPLTIVVHFTPEQVAGRDPASLQIQFFDESLGEWVGLPTTVDLEAGTLTTVLDHLTLFGITGQPLEVDEVAVATQVRDVDSSGPAERSSSSRTVGVWSWLQSWGIAEPVPQSERRQIYTVRWGDTLRAIADRVYGNPLLFWRILEANRDQLLDPNVIRAGMDLNIPSPPR